MNCYKMKVHIKSGFPTFFPIIWICRNWDSLKRYVRKQRNWRKMENAEARNTQHELKLSTFC